MPASQFCERALRAIKLRNCNLGTELREVPIRNWPYQGIDKWFTRIG